VIIGDERGLENRWHILVGHQIGGLLRGGSGFLQCDKDDSRIKPPGPFADFASIRNNSASVSGDACFRAPKRGFVSGRNARSGAVIWASLSLLFKKTAIRAPVDEGAGVSQACRRQYPVAGAPQLRPARLSSSLRELSRIENTG